MQRALVRTSTSMHDSHSSRILLTYLISLKNLSSHTARSPPGHRTDVTLPHPDAIPSDQPCWLPGMSKSSFLPGHRLLCWTALYLEASRLLSSSSAECLQQHFCSPALQLGDVAKTWCNLSYKGTSELHATCCPQKYLKSDVSASSLAGYWLFKVSSQQLADTTQSGIQMHHHGRLRLSWLQPAGRASPLGCGGLRLLWPVPLVCYSPNQQGRASNDPAPYHQ